MSRGVVKRRGGSLVIGRWIADRQSITVQTDDPALRSASDQILKTAQPIPVHGADRFEFPTQAERQIEAPATIKYLALFALELEALGYVVEPEEEAD